VSEEHDRQFIRNFSSILAGLLVFAVIILVLAIAIHNRNYRGEPSSARQAAVEDRIRPVAGVYAGESGRQAAQAAAEAETAVAETSSEDSSEDGTGDAAAEGTADGQGVYTNACAACHDTGAAGAPRLTANEMGARLADKGRDTLLSNAINGINAMPPRGGRADLSDAEMAAAVDYMLEGLD